MQSKKRIENIQKVNKQSGAALFVALIMLLALTIIGISASQRSSIQERMAANMHLDNMTFSAAESALGAFITEANTGNKLDPNHVLFKLRVNGNIGENQYDLNGQRVAVGYLDSNNNGGSLVASINPAIFDDCNKNCGGFSFGGDIGCRFYRLDGQATLTKSGENIKTDTNTMWAREVTACN